MPVAPDNRRSRAVRGYGGVSAALSERPSLGVASRELRVVGLLDPWMPPSVRPARGMRDFLPEDVRRREYVIAIVEETYRRYGFEPLETPALENIETLTGKYGEEGNKLIFKVLRRGEHESSGRDRPGAALRPDRAAGARRRRAPRQAAEVLQALPDPAGVARRPAGARPVPRVLPVRRRRDRVAVAGRRGRAVLGGQRCPAASSASATSSIRLNHRAAAGGPARCGRRRRRTLHGQALVALDKLDKIGADGVRRELQERGASPADGERLLAALRRRRRRCRACASCVAGSTARRRRAIGRARSRSSALAAATSAGRARAASTPRWRAGCRTTPARSWRSPCRISPAASAAAAATTA